MDDLPEYRDDNLPGWKALAGYFIGLPVGAGAIGFLLSEMVLGATIVSVPIGLVVTVLTFLSLLEGRMKG